MLKSFVDFVLAATKKFFIQQSKHDNVQKKHKNYVEVALLKSYGKIQPIKTSGKRFEHQKIIEDRDLKS